MASVKMETSSSSPPEAGSLLNLLQTSRNISVPLSCSQEFRAAKEFATTIQHFDWSHFPIFSDDNYYETADYQVAAARSERFSCQEERSSPVIFSNVSPCVSPSPTFSRRASAPALTSRDAATVAKLTKSSQFRKKGSQLQLKKQNKTSRKVRFSPVVKIHALPLTLGYHPCCDGGMALSVDWVDKNDGLHLADLEAFENHSLKRRPHELRLDYQSRQQRLEDSTGFTSGQLLLQELDLVCQIKEKDIFCDASDDDEYAPAQIARSASSLRKLSQIALSKPSQ